jgi:glucan phosphorylase
VIYGGKAHPEDKDGKAVIRRIFEFAAELADEIRICTWKTMKWNWPGVFAPASICG